MKKKNPQLILAPMAGITDLPFRLICKEYGADKIYSEMISVAGLTHNNKQKTLAYLKSCLTDKPLIAQFFGSDPKQFAQSTKLLNALPEKNKSRKIDFYRPEGIDINFGCPVKKVFKQNAGCALMKNPDLARQIISAVCENTSLPVSIKIRAEIENINALQFLEKIADLPWQTVIVHGRTFSQGFSGPINLELIKNIKQLYPQKTVIANGGIFSPETAQEVLIKTGADGLAIGRGALGQPWIFQDIKALLIGKKTQKKTLTSIKKIALSHAYLVKKIFGDQGFLEFRKHLGWYFKNYPGAKNLRKSIFQIKTFQEAEEIIGKI